MFGIKFIRSESTDYILCYKNGRVVREGRGLAFFYYAPTTSLVMVPLASEDVPFIFEEVSADFQELSIQGQVTYRIIAPKKIADMLNFTLSPRTRRYVSEDPVKLPQRVIQLVQVLVRAALQNLKLTEALTASEQLVTAIRGRLSQAPELEALGLEVLGLSILAIKPNPETSRALEAEVREALLRRSDEAVYSRRNAAIEQERSIKENELNTEIAVENKKRQIRETQMDAERAVMEKRRQLHDEEMTGRTALEQKRKLLVGLESENKRAEADVRGYAIGAVLKSLSGADPKIIQALATAGMQPEQLIAAAFKELAEGAERIGQLNISPELLRELLAHQTTDLPVHQSLQAPSPPPPPRPKKP